MGLKECNIQLCSSWGGYHPGQIVSGNVVCTFDSPKTLRGIIINIKGRSETIWRVTQTTQVNGRSETRTVVHSASEEYFNVSIKLLGNNNGDKIEVPAGTHAYPFQYTLPPNLPSSFEDSYGFIRYTLKATLIRPWKFDHEAKTAFTVVSDMDLNTLPDAIKPLRIEMIERFRCWCCKSGPLIVNVDVPRSGYCSGETIPLEINVENGSDVSVNRVVVELNKIVTFHSQSTQGTKKLITTMAKVNTGNIQSYSTKYYKECLLVPPLPPSNLLNCSIIDLDYELKIICVNRGCHANKDKSSKIFIGTVPIGYKQQQVSTGYTLVEPGMSKIVSADTPLLISTLFQSPNLTSTPSNPSNTPYPIITSQPSLQYTTEYSTANYPPPYSTPHSPHPYYGPHFNKTPTAPQMENETDTESIVPSVNTTCPYPTAQPLYRESQFYATTIHDSADNQHTRILGNRQFAPFYPTYEHVTKYT